MPLAGPAPGGGPAAFLARDRERAAEPHRQLVFRPAAPAVRPRRRQMSAPSAGPRQADAGSAPGGRGSGRNISPRAIVVAALFAAVIGLSIWYLVKPEPLLVQGETQSTRIDIAARVSGRLAKIAVSRGENVAAGTTLLVIDNPELLAELREAKAEKTVADAELARIVVGTRPEIIALRKAEIDRAAADLTLAQQTYGRTRTLAAQQFAPQSKLDEDAD